MLSVLPPSCALTPDMRRPAVELDTLLDACTAVCGDALPMPVAFSAPHQQRRLLHGDISELHRALLRPILASHNATQAGALFEGLHIEAKAATGLENKPHLSLRATWWLKKPGCVPDELVLPEGWSGVRLRGPFYRLYANVPLARIDRFPRSRPLANMRMATMLDSPALNWLARHRLRALGVRLGSGDYGVLAAPDPQTLQLVDGQSQAPLGVLPLAGSRYEGMATLLRVPLAKSADKAQAKTTRVLVADDSATARTALKMQFEQLGCSVTAVADGSAVLAAGAQQPFELILLDIEMGATNGLEVCRALRSQGGPNAAATIVVLSGHIDVESEVREAGADEFLHKPVRRARLADVLARHSAAGAPLIDPSILDTRQLDSLAEEIGRDALADILQAFAEELQAHRQGFLQSVRTRAEQQDFSRHAHTLKSSAATVGANALSQLASAIDQHCKQHPLPIEPSRIKRVLTCIDATQHALGQFQMSLANRSGARHAA